jgi:hypothetical protein
MVSPLGSWYPRHRGVPVVQSVSTPRRKTRVKRRSPSLAPSTRTADLLIGCWAVGEEGDARVEHGRGDQLHPDPAAVEGPFAIAPDHGVDSEVELVGQSLGGELVRELAAAERDQVPAVLALEPGHALGQVALAPR